MPDQKELNQQDVFSYIDRQMKTDSGTQSDEITQRTRPNFRFTFLVDLIAIIISLSGFYGVYNIFQERAYNLVGSEDSIKGLEDVLYQELQKRASAELESTQEELAAIQAQLDTINADMEDFIAEQEALMEQELAQKQKELQDQLEAQLAGASEEEKEEIMAQYETQMASIETELQSQIQQKEQEMESERERLLALQQASQSELANVQTELEETQAEYEQKLEEERATSQAALEEVELELEQKQLVEDYLYQINALFKGAITSYKNSKYDDVRSKLASVESLYNNKPADVILSTQQEDVDLFFVSIIEDVLTLREQGYASAEEIPASGSTTIDVDAINAEAAPDFTAAKQEFQSGEYDSALTAFQNVIVDYPYSDYTDQALDYIGQIYEAKTSEATVDVDSALAQAATEQTAASQRIYNRASTAMKSENYEDAFDNYLSLIEQYPNSDYVGSALDDLQTIFEERENLEKVTEEQTADSIPTYNNAVAEQNSGNYITAVEGYRTVIKDYPLSEYADDSIDNIYNIAYWMDSQMSAMVFLSTVESEQTANSATLYNQALTAYNGAEYDTAAGYFVDLIMDYPLSDNVYDSLTKLKTIITTKKFSTNQIAQIQTENSLNAYRTALTLLNNQEYQDAAEAYAELIQTYPYSYYVTNAVADIQSIMSVMVNLEQLGETQNAQAKVLFEQAEEQFDSELYLDAIETLSTLISSYPVSDYVKNGLNKIREILSTSYELKTEGMVDIETIRENQNKSAKSVYNSAVALVKKENYVDAIEKLSDLINDYPISDYVDDSLTQIDKIVTYYKEELESIQSEAGISDDMEVKSKTQYQEALAFIDDEEYLKAMESFKILVKTYPLSDYADTALDKMEEVAELYQAQVEKMVDLDELTATQNKSAVSAYNKALAKADDGDYVEAVKSFATLINTYPVSGYVDDSLNKIQEIVSDYKENNDDLKTKAGITDEMATKSKALYQSALTDVNNGDYSDAMDTFKTLISTYPLSEYTDDALDQLESVMESYQSRVDEMVDLDELTASQNKLAVIQYNAAIQQADNGNYVEAVGSLSELITSYPVSDYVDDSLVKIEEIVSEYKKNNDDLKTKANITDDMNEKAKTLYEQGQTYYDNDQYPSAIAVLTELMTDYPLSEYTDDGITMIEEMINNYQSQVTAMVYLDEVKKEQTADAKMIYNSAITELDSGNYDKAFDYFADLIMDYPLSTYVKNSLTKIEELMELNEEAAKESLGVQTAVYLENAYGRVTDSLGDEVFFDLLEDSDLSVGDEVYIYRKLDAATVEYIGSATVTEVSSLISKAEIDQFASRIKSGDLIFKRK